MDTDAEDETPKLEHTTDEQDRMPTGGEDVAGFARGAFYPAADPGRLELPLTILPISLDPEPNPWKRRDPEPWPWKEAGEAASGPLGL